MAGEISWLRIHIQPAMVPFWININTAILNRLYMPEILGRSIVKSNHSFYSRVSDFKWEVACISLALSAAINANASTVEIVTDTDISSSTTEDYYRVHGGALLSGSEARTGNLSVGSFTDPTSGRVHLTEGSLINGFIELYDNGSAELDDATVTSSIYVIDTNSNLVLKRSSVLGVIEASGGTIQASDSSINSISLSSAVNNVILTNSHIASDTSSIAALYMTDESAAKLIGSTVEGSVGVQFDKAAATNNFTSLIIDHSSVSSTTGPAINVGLASFGSENAGKADILMSNNSLLNASNGTAMNVQYGSEAKLRSDASRIEGDIIVDDTSSAEMSLNNSSYLRGRVLNLNSMTVSTGSTWEMTQNSNVGAMVMNAGSVNFGVSRSSEFRTLTLGELSGNGEFYMQTDVAGQKRDFLNVTGSAIGSYLLHVANTGAEPEKTAVITDLVHAGSGDANFSLTNGKVDIGTWQYELVKHGNEWGLVQAGTAFVDPDGRIVPVTPTPVTPTPDKPVDDIVSINPSPGLSTSASTDAVLSMASVQKNMFYGEMDILRNRTSENNFAGGAWGTFINNASRFNGAWGSEYRLHQNGLLLGVDTATYTSFGNLITGIFLSQSGGDVKHARGGKSNVDAWGTGLYAVFNTASGWYASGILKVNRFSNDLSAEMSDGSAVSGSWDSSGWGGMLEAGYHFYPTENASLTPYLGLSSFQNQDKHISLDNGMNAELGNGRSLRGEAGIRTAVDLHIAGANVTPYANIAILQEMAKSDSVKINNDFNFENDYTGISGRAGAGVSISVTPLSRIWIEATYSKGEHNETPFGGSAGVRISF
ncbi:autotransporter outer membrane beta-barrel domain-containing protein [Pantoea agglomerans]|uniref:autotransporter outer membrane beta-barrel domain-containing protein n=1 Tax=Enterobacter agglomerans TaxID=549 RepID=UPI001053E66D|nr:autotransporter outer membrane beta-barrel domain-containing protein [Pantoea agglomerans]TCZ21589.1 autotransporter outer membrane beta-barrel domain-containing protein [Pantoea agglomerans]